MTYRDIFPGLSRTKVIFQDFPGPGNFNKKVQDFPGGVGTLATPLQTEYIKGTVIIDANRTRNNKLRDSQSDRIEAVAVLGF